MTKAVGIAVMRKHGALFRGLPAAEQFEYEARARQRVASERKDIDDALDNLVAARELRVRRLQDEELGIAEAFRVANCRFSSTDLSSLASLWNSDKYSIQGVAQLRQLAHVAPQTPAKHALDRLADFAVDETVGRSPPCPRWCVPVCRLREVFQGGVFRFTTHNENLFYLFLYATQNPLMAAFLPLEVAERVPVVETAYAVGEGILCSGPPFDHVFSVVGRTHCTGSDIAVTENTVIQVLPHAVFVDDRHVASHADFVPLQAWLVDLRFQEPATTSQATLPRTWTADVLATYPWLADFVRDQSGRATDRGAEATGVPPTPQVVTLEEDVAERVFAELREKRQLWEVEFAAPPEDFKTTLLGGAWTLQHRGVVCDAVKAYAAGATGLSFCRAYQLPKAASFAIRKYGEAVASALAIHWCARLQSLCTAARGQTMGSYVFTAADLESCPAPEEVLQLLQEQPQSHPGHVRLAEISALLPAGVLTGSGARSSTD